MSLRGVNSVTYRLTCGKDLHQDTYLLTLLTYLLILLTYLLTY